MSACPDCERVDCPDHLSATGMDASEVNECKDEALRLLRSRIAKLEAESRLLAGAVMHPGASADQLREAWTIAERVISSVAQASTGTKLETELAEMKRQVEAGRVLLIALGVFSKLLRKLSSEALESAYAQGAGANAGIFAGRADGFDAAADGIDAICSPFI